MDSNDGAYLQHGGTAVFENHFKFFTATKKLLQPTEN